jgi:hypothetical protein
MACSAFTAAFPEAEMPPGQTYEAYIRTQASQNGLMCGLANYAANCQSQCVNVAKAQFSSNSNLCFQCLQSVQSCANPAAPTEPCCPFMGPATQCNDCLNAHDTDALAQCLQGGGLSPGAIAGIVIAVVVVVLAIVIGVIVWYYRAKTKLVKKLGRGDPTKEREYNALSLTELQRLDRSQV